MRRRAMGLETEYGHFCTDQTGGHWAGVAVNDILWPRLPGRTFCRNCGRLYQDNNNHAEYATPECDHGHQVATYALAGDRIVQSRFENYMQRKREERSPGFKGMDNYFVFKNNVCSYEPGELETCGSHQNYQTSAETVEDVTWPLIAFWATSPLFFGAGNVVVNGIESRFELSQRARFINCVYYTSAHMGHRPFVMTRDEPLAAGTQRIQMVGGDTNLMPQLVALKFDITDLLLTMAEEGVLPSLDLANPVRALQACSRDMNAKFGVIDRGYWSALDVQRFYYQQADKFVCSHPDLARHYGTLAGWSQLIATGEEHDWQAFIGLTDWASKRDWIQGYNRRMVERRLPLVQRLFKRQQLDLACHQLVGEGALNQRFLEHYGVYDHDAVTAAINTPPQNTRARVRGLAMTARCRGVSWAYYEYQNKQGKMPDPLDNTVPEHFAHLAR